LLFSFQRTRFKIEDLYLNMVIQWLSRKNFRLELPCGKFSFKPNVMDTAPIVNRKVIFPKKSFFLYLIL
jgi:hypothetical protein